MPESHEDPIVLIVDDDDQMRFLARAAIEAVGLRAAEAGDGHAALRFLDQERPDLVVLDIMMPGIDGFETCARVRAHPGCEHVPILIMTGREDLESITRAYEAGATDFITKPIHWTIFGHTTRYMVRAGRALTELQEARVTAEQANRVKGEFMANMSHELRTPMTAILGYLDLLLDRDQSEQEREDYLQIVRRNGLHLLSILNDILDISKLEDGRVEVEQIDVDLRELVSEVEHLMRRPASERGLSFVVEYRSAIPKTIRSDPTRLKQILTNLLGNAIKFTASGEVRLVVELLGHAEDPGPKLRFQVIDTGIGISPRDQERLFEPFEQADSSTTRRFGGTGLGLAISRRLALCLGGDLTVTSQPDRGSVFSATIPTGSLAGVKMVRPARAGHDPGAASHEEPRTRLEGRVLLAEDGADNRRLITTVLRKAGVEADVAEDGEVALDMAIAAIESGHPYDVILMDVQMPRRDGLSATRELRTRDYRGTIIALTAHARDDDRRQCLGAGCDDFLTKPIDRARFLSVLGWYLAAKRSDDHPEA